MTNTHTTQNNLKHAKVRNGRVHVNACIDNVRYRFSTAKMATAKNLAEVNKNYLWYIEQYKIQKKLLNSDLDISIENYGYEVLEHHCKSKKKSTYTRYENIFKKYIVSRIGNLSVNSIKPRNAREVFAKFDDISDTNRALVLNILKMIFSHAVLDEVVDKNPFLHVKNHRKKVLKEAKHTAFSEEEMQKILSLAKDYLSKLYLFIAFFTGMRPNEILALKGEDIDLERGYIHVYGNIVLGEYSDTKNHKYRAVEIPEPLRVFLEKHFLGHKRDEFIFIGRYGRRLQEQSMVKRYKKILKEADLEEATLYSTRHTFASLMLQAGEDMQWISKQLGHSDISITNKHYIIYKPKEQKRGEAFIQLIEKTMQECA